LKSRNTNESFEEKEKRPESFLRRRNDAESFDKNEE
jgi:hypothetical protein